MWKWTKRIVLCLFIGQFVYIFFVKYINPPFTITQIVSLFEGHGFRRDNISYQDMPDNIKLAIIASEDQNFPTHNGFDLENIQKAITYNATHDKKMRGGSTISQQVAKNIFLWQGRSWIRKGLEAYFTFMIETFYSKQRILELYLNNAEMGIGVFGVQEASQYYFKKEASQLTENQSARLAVVLPNPKKYSVNPPSTYVANRANWVQKQMHYLKGNKKIEAILH